jgi:membrane protein
MQLRSLKELKDRTDSFLWADRSAENRWQRAGIRTLQIGYAVIRDLAQGNLSLRAMSLVYYTVIAFVPLLALAFAVLKGLGVHNELEPALLGLLQPFMGEYSIEIAQNVVGFVDNVRVDVLSVVSLGVLLYTVLTMMQRIELSFNYIWSVAQARSLGSRVSEYLFAIIVAPLLILISVGIASYVNTVFFVRLLESLPTGALLLQFVGLLTPFLFMSLAFALAFIFIPNTRVRFRSAFIGGIVTTIAWKLMGWVFQNFITEYSANAVIYAAFFAVILLMLVIYLGWLMLLIGSSVAFYHQHPSKTYAGREPPKLSLRLKEEVDLTIALLIVKRFQQGVPPWSADELQAYTRLSPAMIESAVQILMAIGLIRATDENPPCYLPVSTVDNCKLHELRHRIRSYAKDHPDNRSCCAEQMQIRGILDEAEQSWSKSWGDTTLKDLIKSEDHE